MSRRVGWLPLSFLLISIGAVVALKGQGAAFRSNIDLISLPVTVTGPGGRHVGNLTADDFDILEDGKPQQLQYFSHAETALSVSLLLDSSSSMEERMPLAQKAAMEFVAKLRPNDIAEIVDFDSRVQTLQPFTTDRRLLESAIQGVKAGGSTSLYNAIYITLRALENVRPTREDDIRREVIVVLSDGDDTSSLVTFEETIEGAKRSSAVIYTIGLGLEEPSTRSGTSITGEFALRRLAQETGGRMFTPKRAEELSNVYTQIADELSDQYVLGYLSRNERHDGRWRSVAVQVRRPQLQARTRTGYYATQQ